MLVCVCASVLVCLATKSVRVKVLVLVYELNVKLTYFKSLWQEQQPGQPASRVGQARQTASQAAGKKNSNHSRIAKTRKSARVEVARLEDTLKSAKN